MERGTSTATLDPTSDERFLSLRRQLGVSSFGLNQITLTPGQRGRIHRHREQEEVYVVLSGLLTLVVEGEERTLGPWQAVRVAPEVRRQLANRGAERVVLLAIGGAGEHVGRDAAAFEDWNDREGRPPNEVPLPADISTDAPR